MTRKWVSSEGNIDNSNKNQIYDPTLDDTIKYSDESEIH